jgi:hypothetical protein
MSTVFLYSAVVGGTLMVLQFLLLLLGAGGDADLGGDHAGLGVDGGVDGGLDSHVGGHVVGHDQGSFLKLFSLQTIVTFATFFGLTGLATEQLGWSPLSVATAAAIAGTGALWLVARTMHALHRLQSSGSLDLDNAVGQPGNVYLRIPAAGQGHGRVLLVVQGRKVECRAISRANEIPTGSPIHVIEHLDGDLLVVEPRP